MITSAVRVSRELALVVQLGVLYLIGNILLRFSCARIPLTKFMEKAANVTLPEELYWESLFTWEMIKNLWQHGKLDIRKVARAGNATPNPLLVDPQSGEEKQLVKILNVDKLHILAFGSYSCPVFRMKFDELKSIARDFDNQVDLSIIYITEAHPSDGWAFKDDSPIAKHRSIEDRINASHKLLALDPERSISVYADSMKDEASKMFGVNAIRLYIVHNQTIVYEGGVGPTYYSLHEVKQVVSKTCTLSV